MSRGRNYVFTINNHDDLTIERLQDELNGHADVRYFIYGVETGASGTPHLQGYIEFTKPIYFTKLNTYPGLERAHFEPRKGTPDQAIAYCKKDGAFCEFGQRPSPGKRTDLENIRESAQSGGMRLVTTIAKSSSAIRVAEYYLTYNEEARDFKPEVHWLWGPTGTGKSYTARQRSILATSKTDVYTKSCGTKWWTGYDSHLAVVIDDFRDSWWSITEMLSLLDRYEKRVEIKGGYRQFKPKIIFITSCSHPSECYKGTGEGIAQLLRRIESITLM